MTNYEMPVGGWIPVRSLTYQPPQLNDTFTYSFNGWNPIMQLTAKQLREIADAVEQLRDLSFEVLNFKTSSHEVTLRKTNDYEQEKLMITDAYVVTGIKKL